MGLNAILSKEEQVIVLHEFVHALGLFHEYRTLTQWPTSGDTGNVRSSEGNIWMLTRNSYNKLAAEYFRTAYHR